MPLLPHVFWNVPKIGAPEPGFLKNVTKKYLKQKGAPVDYFASLTDPHLVGQRMVEMPASPTSRKRSLEEKREPPAKQGKTEHIFCNSDTFADPIVDKRDPIRPNFRRRSGPSQSYHVAVTGDGIEYSG